MRWLKVRYRMLRRALRTTNTADSEIAVDAVHATTQRIFWTAPVMVIGNFLAALGFWLQEEPSAAIEALWRQLIIRTNFAVSVISVGFWLLAWIIQKKKPSIKVQKAFIYSVVIYVLALGLTITLIDQLVMASLTPFLLCVVIIGTFYYIPPKNSFVIFSLGYIVFRLAFSSFHHYLVGDLSSNLINGMVASALGFALSFVNWQHFRRTTTQERTIAKQQEVLKRMAYHDFLTGLPNRRQLDELVKQELKLVEHRHVESSLIICDIDDFKQVNDTYGHIEGDNLLKQFSALLQEEMRGSNILVRLGGEEFVVLAPRTSEEEAEVLANRLRSVVQEHKFTVEQNTKVGITASFGVAALFAADGTRGYYYRADRALYEAKRSGKNRVMVAGKETGAERDFRDEDSGRAVTAGS